MDLKQINWGVWGVKTALSSLVLGGLFYLAAQNSVTVAETVAALASIPLPFVVLIELFDKVADKKDYYRKIYAQFGGKDNQGAALLATLAMAILTFFTVVWALTGTMVVSVGSIGFATFFVAGLLTVYILAPETGDDELVLWAWLAATIATQGQYLVLFPAIAAVAAALL